MRLLLLSLLLIATTSANQVTPHRSAEETGVQKGSAKQEARAENPQQRPTQPSTHNGDYKVKAVHAGGEMADLYDPRSDTLYRAYLGFTIVGVLGAIVGIIVLISQTRATANAARAAAESTTSYKRSERAWLVIRPDRFSLGGAQRFDWIISNTGKTTAAIIESGGRCVCLKSDGKRLQEPPDYGRGVVPFYSAPIAPNDSTPMWVYIELNRDGEDRLTEADVDLIRAQMVDLVAYGFANYRDVFGVEHISRFCYRYDWYTQSFRMHHGAPAAYHECD